jgi:hypothetical protein
VSRLRGEMEEKDRLLKEKDRAVVQLRRELIDVDSQLDNERRRFAAIERAEKEKEKSVSTSNSSGVKQQDHESLGFVSGMSRMSHAGSVTIPSAQREDIPRPPEPAHMGSASRVPTAHSSRGVNVSLSETFTNQSPPPRTRSARSAASSTGAGDVAGTTTVAGRAYPTSSSGLGGSPAPVRARSPAKSNTASYAATTAAFRSGREGVLSEGSTESGGGSNGVSEGQHSAVGVGTTTSATTSITTRASSRVRTVRSSASTSSSHQREGRTSLDLPATGYGRVVPEWRDIEPQGAGGSSAGRARDISPVLPRRSTGAKSSGATGLR